MKDQSKFQGNKNKTYLGDGVYVEVEGHVAIVTTENGIQTTNAIHLETDVFLALVSFVNSAWEPPKESMQWLHGAGRKPDHL